MSLNSFKTNSCPVGMQPNIASTLPQWSCLSCHIMNNMVIESILNKSVHLFFIRSASASASAAATPTRKTQSRYGGSAQYHRARMHSCQHQGQQPLSPERPATHQWDQSAESARSSDWRERYTSRRGIWFNSSLKTEGRFEDFCKGEQKKKKCTMRFGRLWWTACP